jgi:hypothetical protein
METRVVEKVPTAWLLLVAGLLMAAPIAGPIAVVATMADSLSRDGSVLAEAAAVVVPSYSAPADSGDIGRFAFGYVEFDWDPTSPGGVPGFDSWPPGSSRR